MPFYDLAEEIPYHDDLWPEGSFWWFYRHRDQADVEFAARNINVVKMQYDPEEEKRARRQGRTYTGDMEQQTKMSARMALISSMSIRWEGEEFRYPIGHHLRNGKPNPLAGQMAPCTYEHILNRPPPELRRIEQWLNDMYEADSDPDTLASFPESGRGMAGPGGRHGGNGVVDAPSGPNGGTREPGGDVPVPEGDLGVPRDADLPPGLVG